MEMSIKYEGCLYWRDNSEWYDFDEDLKRYVLTYKAPAKARKSFALWEKLLTVEKSRRELESVWSANSEWYYFDEESERYVLTDKAPAKARLAFEEWKKVNGLK